MCDSNVHCRSFSGFAVLGTVIAIHWGFSDAWLRTLPMGKLLSWRVHATFALESSLKGGRLEIQNFMKCFPDPSLKNTGLFFSAQKSQQIQLPSLQINIHLYPLPAMVWSRWSLTAPLLVDAWFDTGHMLVAHIAKGQLPKEQVETVERLLNMWSNDFPEMSTFVSSSVWPDHIKCTNSEAPVCSGLPATALDAYLVWSWNLGNGVLHILLHQDHQRCWWFGLWLSPSFRISWQPKLQPHLFVDLAPGESFNMGLFRSIWQISTIQHWVLLQVTQSLVNVSVLNKPGVEVLTTQVELIVPSINPLTSRFNAWHFVDLDYDPVPWDRNGWNVGGVKIEGWWSRVTNLDWDGKKG